MNSDNIDDVRQSADSYVKEHYWGYLILLGIISLAIVACIVFSGTFNISNVPALILPLVFFFVGYCYLWNIAYKKLQHVFMQQFAQTIGYSYTPTIDIKTLNAKLFTLGNGSGRVLDVMSGIYKTRPVRIFNFDFSIPGGKTPMNITYTVLEVTIENSLPNIILNSKDKDFVPKAIYKPDNNEHVMLEGDFNDYFSLYVPKGFETDAYTIFSPDKMVTLIDKAKNFSFEFNGNHVYIFSDQQIETREQMQKFFDFSDYLYLSFGHSLEIVGK